MHINQWLEGLWCYIDNAGLILFCYYEKTRIDKVEPVSGY